MRSGENHDDMRWVTLVMSDWPMFGRDGRLKFGAISDVTVLRLDALERALGRPVFEGLTLAIATPFGDRRFDLTRPVVDVTVVAREMARRAQLGAATGLAD